MKLEVTKIHLLASGKLLVEVSGESEANPPIPSALDHITIRLYMAHDPSASIESLKADALAVACSSIKSI